MKWIINSVFLFLTGFISLSAQENPVNPCSQDKAYRQFDFWIGSWEVKGHDGQLFGHNTVKLILDQCVIMENWTGAGPSRGKSFNYYDQHTGKWHQQWVDNGGSHLDLEGEVRDGAAVFRGESKARNGDKLYNELTIKKGKEGTVLQIWKQSKDGIKWRTVFDAVYYKLPNEQTQY